MSKAIAYILNPEKTDEKLLVSSYGCASETAAREFEWTRKIAEQKGMNPVRIIARHVIQSFEIGEVTPELAHEIGKQFADEILGGKYEYVLTTHIDKDHVHNHLIFNAVDFVDYHAYKSYKRIYYDMREVSDRLCKENGLSVIPPSQNKGMGYKEYTEAKRGTSWKQKLKQTIDRLVITAKDYDDFLRLMQEAGYEIKIGKFPFTASGKASAAGANEGFIKLIFNAADNTLLGAHMVGMNVTEMIAEMVLARKVKATAHDIIKTVHPHPTMSEAVMEAAAAAYDEVIHI